MIVGVLCGLLIFPEPHAALYNQRVMKQVVHAACPHDRPDACAAVFNRGGRYIFKSESGQRGAARVVCAQLSWAKLAPQGRNSNVLTSEKLTDLGNSATFYSVLVEVELFQTAS